MSRNTSVDRPDIAIAYRFEFGNEAPIVYDLVLDGRTLSLQVDPVAWAAAPDWTRLDFYRCDACTLEPTARAHCPVAVNLNQAATRFCAEVSIKRVKVTVTTVERTYYKETSLQNGLYSLFGLIMATSGCPVLDFLKPMARFHLPFASMDETVMRTTSMYLLGQYFAVKRGEPFDQEFKGLDEHYRKVARLNRSFSKRISRITRGDAEHNAINILHNFACMTTLVLENNLDYLEYLWCDRGASRLPQESD
jgi:hypothetical protein